MSPATRRTADERAASVARLDEDTIDPTRCRAPTPAMIEGMTTYQHNELARLLHRYSDARVVAFHNGTMEVAIGHRNVFISSAPPPGRDGSTMLPPRPHREAPRARRRVSLTDPEALSLQMPDDPWLV